MAVFAEKAEQKTDTEATQEVEDDSCVPERSQEDSQEKESMLFRSIHCSLYTLLSLHIALSTHCSLYTLLSLSTHCSLSLHIALYTS